MIVVVDVSALYAAFDAAQPDHLAAANIVEHETLILSPLVLTDIDHLGQRALGRPATLELLDALTTRIGQGRHQLAELRHADLVAANDLRHSRHGPELDLAGAVGVVLADRYQTNCVLTLDEQSYRAVSPLAGRFDAFRVLPADSGH